MPKTSSLIKHKDTTKPVLKAFNELRSISPRLIVHLFHDIDNSGAPTTLIPGDISEAEAVMMTASIVQALAYEYGGNEYGYLKEIRRFLKNYGRLLNGE